MGEAELWRRFGEGEAGARGELIEHHRRLVKNVAHSLIDRRLIWGAQVEQDDLLSAGVLGLMQAIDRWDPARGATSFRNYAWHRISGAILDAQRASGSYLMTSGRRKQSQIVPTDFRGTLGQAPDPDDDMGRIEGKVDLVRALAALDAKSRSVVIDRFWHELTLTEIGESWGVTESRACQMVKHSLGLLRHRLAEPNRRMPGEVRDDDVA